MASCCSRYSVPTAIMAECYISTCTRCGAEYYIFYDDERVQRWKDDGKQPIDEVQKWCSQRYPDANPIVKR